jgi:hypothetical protein
MKFSSRRREEKLYCLQNDVQTYVSVYPIKTEGEMPMYLRSVSLFSLCQGKEAAKTIYISLDFINYRD